MPGEMSNGAKRHSGEKIYARAVNGLNQGEVHPATNGDNSDSNKLLNRFPTETWNQIGDYLGDQQDVDSLFSASASFRNLIVPNRVLVLFPQVWEILAKKYHTMLNDPSYNEACSAEATSCGTRNGPCGRCGRSRSIYWYSGIIKLRLVCQTWRKAIDNFYQNHVDHFRMEDDVNGRVEYICNWMGNAFSDGSPELTRNFLQHFGDSGTNPFFDRSVVLRYDDIAYLKGPQVASEIMNVLRKYGTEIWYCTISTVNNPHINYVLYYRVLKIWLQHMPNLKTLCLKHPEKCIPRTGHAEKLEAEVRGNPLKTLDNLQFLKMMKRPTQIFREVLRVNSHVSGLEIMKENTFYGRQVFPASLPNLKELSYSTHFPGDIRNFKSGFGKCALTKLHVAFDNCGAFFEWGDVFSLLETWSETLTDVTIWLPVAIGNAKIIEADGLSKLNLKRVKRLKLVVFNICPLDFILPLKDTLEHLEIFPIGDLTLSCHHSLIATAKQKQKIQVLGYFDNLLESNIWSIFPKLSRVLITNESYGRYGVARSYNRRQWKNRLITPS